LGDAIKKQNNASCLWSQLWNTNFF